MGSVWRRLGTQVTVVEYLDRIVPSMDLEIGANFQKILTRSEEHTSELQSRFGISYAVFCLKKKK